MSNDWLPIETYELPVFDADNWYINTPNVLLWDGDWSTIGNYAYTKKGKGRWRDWRGTVEPSFWMSLPNPPKTA